MGKSPVNYKEIENYVNDTVSSFMTPIKNVESVRCARLADGMYIELVHEDGDSRYFDVSTLEKSQIGLMIGHILANNEVNTEIKDRNRRIEVRRLFK